MAELNEALIIKLSIWLKFRGREFFRACVKYFGSISAIIPVPKDCLEGSLYPHVIYNSEARQVRNWLRDQPECKDWNDPIDFEAMWDKYVMAAIEYSDHITAKILNEYKWLDEETIDGVLNKDWIIL